jgi:hypothetical protein
MMEVLSVPNLTVRITSSFLLPAISCAIISPITLVTADEIALILVSDAVRFLRGTLL